MMGLTPRQADCLAVIRARVAGGHKSPTFAEIAADLGIGKSNVHRLVHGLIERGFIRALPYRAQSITLIEQNLRGDTEGLLAQLSARRGIPRDRLIQQAVTEFLEREIRA